MCAGAYIYTYTAEARSLGINDSLERLKFQTLFFLVIRVCVCAVSAHLYMRRVSVHQRTLCCLHNFFPAFILFIFTDGQMEWAMQYGGVDAKKKIRSEFSRELYALGTFIHENTNTPFGSIAISTILQVYIELVCGRYYICFRDFVSHTHNTQTFFDPTFSFDHLLFARLLLWLADRNQKIPISLIDREIITNRIVGLYLRVNFSGHRPITSHQSISTWSAKHVSNTVFIRCSVYSIQTT